MEPCTCDLFFTDICKSCINLQKGILIKRELQGPSWLTEWKYNLLSMDDVGTVHGDFILGIKCDCEHGENPNHDLGECYVEECMACGMIKADCNPLHYHHDGCPICDV